MVLALREDVKTLIFVVVFVFVVVFFFFFFFVLFFILSTVIVIHICGDREVHNNYYTVLKTQQIVLSLSHFAPT